MSAIILAHGSRPELAVVLKRLASEPVDEVLVVDNGPRGGLAATLNGSDGRVRVLEPGVNLGIDGRNVAARVARGELLLMLDDDSFPLPGAVPTLVDAFRRRPRLGVAGGLVRDVGADGSVRVVDEVGTFDWWLRAGRRGADPPDGFAAFFFPEGACMIRRAAYLEAGGFFAPYFWLSSEIDLATRLIGRGWDVRYLPAAAFDHMKAPGGRSGAARAMEYRIRNHLWYLWLRFPAVLAARRIVAYLAFDLIECLYRRVPGAWARAIVAAWRERDLVRGHRRPLPRAALRRAELNRGRMHLRLVAARLRERLPRAAR